MADEVILMDEMIIKARNIIISGLAAATGVAVRLSDEQDPEDEPPYAYYSIVTPYASTGEFGSHIRKVVKDAEDGKKYIHDYRYEHPEMVLSFNFCSANRQLDDGTSINGENEAMSFAMKGVAWFKNEGAAALSASHLVVLQITNCASRSGILADEYIRRWGFDAAVRYKAITKRIDDIVENANVIKI